MIKMFSAFTGIGSPEMALRNINANYEVVGISEVDKFAILAYKAIHCNNEDIVVDRNMDDLLYDMTKCNIAYNFSTNKKEMPTKKEDIVSLYKAHKLSKNYGDIRLINEKELPEFNMFTYSFPCKNISIAGEQAGFSKGGNTQSSLLWECERIIAHKKPKYLLMENVKNLVSKKHIAGFHLWIDRLKELGYTSEYKVLNGCNYNIPQNRERVMMVSVLSDKCPKLPLGQLTNSSVDDLAECHKHVDLNLSYNAESVNIFKTTALPMQLNHIGNINGKTHSNNRVYSAIGYCPTLNSMNGGNRQPKIDFNNITRRLSTLECWRLMGFSDEDHAKAKKVIPKSKLYERAGRGIVVPMLESIFKSMGFANV